MLVCGEGYGRLWIEFSEDNAVDAVFVGSEVQAGVFVAVIVPLLPTEYRQREIQKADANRAQNIRIPIPAIRSLGAKVPYTRPRRFEPRYNSKPSRFTVSGYLSELSQL